MKNEFDRLSTVQPLIKSLYEASKESLGFGPDAKIVILTNEENSNNPLGKTAYYDPANHKIGLYTQGRHVKDIMRSLSHELVHHSQNCRGDFNEGLATVEGYAQEDSHLREMEREAYETGNLIFRDWEDNYKRNDSTKLFTDTSIMGEKLMEDKNKEIQLREMIRKMVKEMLVTVKEGDGDSSFFNPDREQAEASEEGAEAASAAALGGVKTSNEGGDEDEPYQGVSENEKRKAKTPGGGDKADVDEEEEGVEKEKEEMDESIFFPEVRDIREKARHQTNEALMNRWGYTKKMINNLNNRWKEFILNEGVTPDISVWVQSLRENLGMIKPRSVRESKRIELMKHQLNEIRKASNRLQRENQILQEENQILQEQGTPKE